MDYITIPEQNIVEKTMQALKQRNIEPILVQNRQEAMEKIKEIIPQGASVMNGSSTTLIEMGFIDYLKSGEHGWNNLHEGIIKEKDSVSEKNLRKQALLSDYYLGSVHALSQEGELVIGSNTGSQLPHIVYSSENVLFVASTNKITPDLPSAIQRLKEFVVPLEEKRMQAAYGMGTYLSKTLIFSREAEVNKRRVRIILVNERLGF